MWAGESRRAYNIGGSTASFDYYISPTGSDSNPGTLASPWSLNAINTKSATYAGKRLGLIGDQGTLTFSGGGVSYPISNSFGVCLSVASGTAGSQTVVGSCNSSGQYVRGLAVIDGGSTSSSTLLSNYAIIGNFSAASAAGYATIKGLTVQNGSSHGILCGNYAAGALAPGIIIQECLVQQIYNPNDGFAGTASASAGVMTVSAVSSGTVAVNDVVYASNGTPLGTVQSFGTGTGGVGTYNLTASVTWASQSVTGTTSAGGNLAGIKAYNNTGLQITDCFVWKVVDLNTAVANNYRSAGIKFFGATGNTVTNTTVYADSVNKQPLTGISWKDSGPNLNGTISNCFIHLANSFALAPETEATGGSSPDAGGQYFTVRNTITVGTATSTLNGFDTVGSGTRTSQTALNWYNNTCAGSGMQRFSPAGTATVTHYNNIYTQSITTGRGMTDFNVDGVALTDYNLYATPFAIGLTASGSSGYPTLYTSFAAYQAAIAAGTTGKEASSASGGATFANASGTFLKATDWQITAASLGFNAGKTGGTSAGATVNMGAWDGTVTQIGCSWKDPS